MARNSAAQTIHRFRFQFLVNDQLSLYELARGRGSVARRAGLVDLLQGPAVLSCSWNCFDLDFGQPYCIFLSCHGEADAVDEAIHSHLDRI